MAYAGSDNPHVKLLNQLENIAPVKVRTYFREKCDNVKEESVMGRKNKNGNFLNTSNN